MCRFLDIHFRIEEVLNEFEFKCCSRCKLYGKRYKEQFCFYLTNSKRKEEVIVFLLVNGELSYDEWNQICLSDQYEC